MAKRQSTPADKQRCKERYWWYVERGICPECGITYAEPGHVYCKACMKRQIAHHKRRNPDGNKHKEYLKALRADRRARGVCVDCEAPIDDGRVYCPKCRERRKENELLCRIRKKMKAEAEKERARVNGG